MISTSGAADPIRSRATLGATSNRLGPAAPGLAEDHDVARIARENRFGRHTSKLMAVRHMNGHTADRDRTLARERRVVRVVHVAEDGNDTRDPLEGLEH